MDRKRQQIMIVLDWRKVCASRGMHLGRDLCAFSEIYALEMRDAQVDKSLQSTKYYFAISLMFTKLVSN